MLMLRLEKVKRKRLPTSFVKRFFNLDLHFPCRRVYPALLSCCENASQSSIDLVCTLYNKLLLFTVPLSCIAGPCEDPVSGEVHQVGDTFYPAGLCESWTCVIGNLQQMMVEIYGWVVCSSKDISFRNKYLYFIMERDIVFEMCLKWAWSGERPEYDIPAAPSRSKELTRNTFDSF